MIRTFLIVANLLGVLCLAATGYLLYAETTWVGPEPSTPEDYFLHGSTGTELMPLPVLQVLPELFPDHFQPGGTEAGDWIDQFGFVRAESGSGPEDDLPVGMSVAKFRPKSGSPSPVPFVGFNCAMCHVGRLRGADGGPGTVVVGMANPALDLVAFGDAVRSSILDEQRLSLSTVRAANERHGRKLPLADQALIEVWLRATRKALREDLVLHGTPFGGKDLRDSALMPSGPGRNQPMKETVRFLLKQTPEPAGGASKIPCLYEQRRRQWAQFDGSLGEPNTRNSLAALGVGATLENLKIPAILHTIQQASVYLRDLKAPRYEAVFPAAAAQLDAEGVRRGAVVYQQQCASCHGSPGKEAGSWENGERTGKVIPIEEVGTDPSRVRFRFYPVIAQTIYDFFPPGHPLKPKREQLRPNPGDPVGLIASPLEGLFSRAPYFHNGSVPTLAQVIQLEPRPAVFYRGSNLYDPAQAGLAAGPAGDAANYFAYRTSDPGNSNKGHDYPWVHRGPGWDEQALKDLLEYLKTL